MGCFVPDLPLFAFAMAHGFEGHSIRGMFVFDLPVGLVALWLFHSFMKQPALIFVPDGIRRRLKAGAYSFLPAARFALIAISILIGSATHILWDAFTHGFYWPARHWRFLRTNVELPIVGHLVMFKVLQYASSVAGLLLVAIWVWYWYRTTDAAQHPIARPYSAAQRSALIVILPLVAIGAGILRAHPSMNTFGAIRPVVNFTADAVVTGIAVFALELLLCGVILRVSKSAGEASYRNS
jgi:hypothetical protein